LFNQINFKSVLGLNFHFVNQNDYIISYCLLSNIQNKIDIVDCKEDVDIDIISQQFPNTPIFLNLSGKIIIEKCIDASLVDLAFPSINKDEFIFQTHQQSTFSIASILRKEKFNSVNTILKASNLSPILLSLGTVSTINAIHSLDNEYHHLEIFDTKITYEEDEIRKIENIDFIDEIYTVSNKGVKGGSLLAFSTGLNAFVNKNDRIQTYDVFQTAYNEFLMQYIYNKLLYVIPILLLIIFGINYTIFQNEKKVNEALNAQNIQNQTILNDLDSLKNEIKTKNDFLNETNWLAQSKVSFYADEIASLKPSSITLTILDIFPAETVLKNESINYQFSNKIIVIEGTSQNLRDLNNWKLSLQNQKWVSKVALEYYNQENELKDIAFTLKINLL
jgi:Tfp pilus assembly protein PilN